MSAQRDSLGDLPSRSITISSTLSLRPFPIPQNVSGNRSRRVSPRVSLSSTHTGIQNSDSWRSFSRQAETSRTASTLPEDIRPFPWTVALKNTCYNRLPFRFKTHSIASYKRSSGGVLWDTSSHERRARLECAAIQLRETRIPLAQGELEKKIGYQLTTPSSTHYARINVSCVCSATQSS
nr:hypothetical protein HmN_000901300 [Hymenolepis microstoma]